MQAAELRKLTVSALKDILRGQGKKLGGRKEELVLRILGLEESTKPITPPSTVKSSTTPLSTMSPYVTLVEPHHIHHHPIPDCALIYAASSSTTMQPIVTISSSSNALAAVSDRSNYLVIIEGDSDGGKPMIIGVKYEPRYRELIDKYVASIQPSERFALRNENYSEETVSAMKALYSSTVYGFDFDRVLTNEELGKLERVMGCGICSVSDSLQLAYDKGVFSFSGCDHQNEL